MDKIIQNYGQNWTIRNLTILDKIIQNQTKLDNIDKIGQNYTKLDKIGQLGQN